MAETKFKKSPRAEHLSKPAGAGNVRDDALPVRRAAESRSHDLEMKDFFAPAYRDFGINE